MSWSIDEVQQWDDDSVSGWLNLCGFADCIDLFREANVNGYMLLDLDEVELIEDIGCTPSEASAVLDAVAAFTSGGTGTNSGDGGEVSQKRLSF
eukprot:gene9905-24720_t